MSERDDEPVRRPWSLRASSPDEVPTEGRETAATLLPEVPRVAALDALLREVDGLRLTLETDLTLAASALEAGAPGLAADIIDSDRDGLRGFEQRALGHLAELASPPAAAKRRRRWALVPAAPFVAAAAVVGFLVGVAPSTLSPATTDVTASNAAATNSLSQLTNAAANGQTNGVREAAASLHDQLKSIVARAKTNPEAAKAALALLSAERAVIEQSGDSSELRDVLAQSARLSHLILQAMPRGVRATIPAIPAVPAAAKPSPAPKPKPKPTSTAPASRPTAQPSSPSKRPSSSPQPAASPSPSSGSQPGPGLPGSPAIGP
jgi:hypothetical protein